MSSRISLSLLCTNLSAVGCYKTLLVYSTLLYSILLYSTLLNSTLLYSSLLYSNLSHRESLSSLSFKEFFSLYTLLYSTLLYSTFLLAIMHEFKRQWLLQDLARLSDDAPIRSASEKADMERTCAGVMEILEPHIDQKEIREIITTLSCYQKPCPSWYACPHWCACGGFIKFHSC